MRSTRSTSRKSPLSSGVPSSDEINQTRKLGLPVRRNDFDRIEKLNPFTQMSSNPAKLHRCVEKVKRKGGADNPWAVCQASLRDGG